MNSAENPETIEAGSGTAEATIVTVPIVLVNGVAESSPPVSKSKLSKKVIAPPAIEPFPLGGTRLIVKLSFSIGGASVSVVSVSLARR